MDINNLKEIVITQKDRYAANQSLIEREQAQDLVKYLPLPHAVTVTGVRRCGKSTLLNQSLQRHHPDQYYFLNFEDERLLNFDVSDFDKLYEVFLELYGERPIFFFDEIQNVTGWEMFVRRMQDGGHKFFLTGSNASMLSQELGTKLTGRHVDLELFPFSFREYLKFKAIEPAKNDIYDVKKRVNLKKLFHQYLQDGGFPEYVNYLQPAILEQIYEDILFRDIVKRYEIKDLKALRELGLWLITNMSRPFSYNKLKNLLTLGSVNTVKNYCHYLEQSYLIFIVSQFSYSLNTQIDSNKKVYIIDNGLANAIAFQFSKNQGQFFENLVFLELRRRYPEIYYYKTENNLEVDFLLRRGNQIEQLIQVCANLDNDAAQHREVIALLKALEETQLNEGLILTDHRQDELKINNKTIHIKPLYQWLLEPAYSSLRML